MPATGKQDAPATALPQPLGVVRTPRLLLWRYGLYLLMVIVAMASLDGLVHEYGIGFFAENGLIEWCETALLASTCCVALVQCRADRSLFGLYASIAVLTAVACVRELDHILDHLLPWGGWKLAAAALLAIGAGLLVRHWQSFKRGLRWLSTQQAFVLFWAGFVIAIPFAQWLGHKPTLRVFLPEAHVGDTRRFIEECIEWLGFLMLLIGVIEIAVARRNEQNDGAGSDRSPRTP